MRFPLFDRSFPGQTVQIAATGPVKSEPLIHAGFMLGMACCA
jgi:hypothetical protein